MTNPPPVAPVEGHLYFLFTEYENTINIRKWSKEPFYGAQEYVSVGELERLRAALQNIRALAAKCQHEGGPDGNFKAIEEFAVYGLEGKNP